MRRRLAEYFELVQNVEHVRKVNINVVGNRQVSVLVLGESNVNRGCA